MRRIILACMFLALPAAAQNAAASRPKLQTEADKLRSENVLLKQEIAHLQQTVQSLQKEIERLNAKLPQGPDDAASAIKQHRLLKGMTADQAVAALGDPLSRSKSSEGSEIISWLDRSNPGVDRRVTGYFSGDVLQRFTEQTRDMIQGGEAVPFNPR
jgi:septal ring factor EnvC (AmiA/AmiB activator)